MITIVKKSNTPLLNNQINRVISLIKELSLVTYENNKTSGFVWSSWVEELATDDKTYKERLIKSIDSGSPLFLATYNGSVVGFALCYEWEDLIKIAMLCVDSSMRGKGYGTELMSAIVKYAKRKKVSDLVVSTETSNIASQKLYTKFGLVPFSIDLGLQL